MSEPVLLFEGMPDLLPMEGRSPGIHVSEVIHDLCIRLGHYEERELDSAGLTRMQLGSSFEWAIANRWALQYPDRYLPMGEMEKDGIFGTPDLVDIEDWAVEEIKLTWVSSRHEPDSQKFWRYWVQIKSYCMMVGTNIGRLSVCHVNGDYKYNDGGGGPVYRKWERQFEDHELAENWRLITTHAKVLNEDKGEK